MAGFLTDTDEQRLRDLAQGLAKGIEDSRTLLNRLGFTTDDYLELSESRTFKAILAQATAEWEGAGNTHKRVRLKAATNIEEALPTLYLDLTNKKEALSSRVKLGELLARIAGLSNPEPVAPGAGQSFNLQINLGGGVKPLIIAGSQNLTLEHEDMAPEIPVFVQASIFNELELETLE